MLDLMNRVVRTALDNALDILASVVDFKQVERMLTVAMAPDSSPIGDAVRHNFFRLQARVTAVTLAEHRIQLDQAVASVGPSYERRLSVLALSYPVVPMNVLDALLRGLMPRLATDWQSWWPEIEDAEPTPCRRCGGCRHPCKRWPGARSRCW
ncbi:hypothetical protein ACTMU2_30275 [Cupriavidus basilensis]